MEAELVGLMDVLDEIERANEYMGEQDVNLNVPIVYLIKLAMMGLLQYKLPHIMKLWTQ